MADISLTQIAVKLVCKGSKGSINNNPIIYSGNGLLLGAKLSIAGKWQNYQK